MRQSILRKLSSSHQTLGIEITDSSVKICEVQQKGKLGVRVLNYGSASLPQNVVEDGKIRDKDKLQEIIKALLVSNTFISKYVHFAIPSQTVMVRSFKLPDLVHVELKKLVQFEMKNNLSLAFDNPYYDFIKLPKLTIEKTAETEQEDNLCDVLVVATPMNILQDYVDIFEALKLVPCSIEIKPFSLLRLIEWSPLVSDGINLIVNVNELNSEITIVEEGSFKITRNVEVSFKSWVNEDRSEKNEWLDNFSSPEQTFQNAAQDLIGELERLMNFYYYTLNKGDKSFQSILLSGDIPQLDKLAALMNESLNPEVIIYHWDLLSVENVDAGWQVPTYAVPLGLALRGSE